MTELNILELSEEDLKIMESMKKKDEDMEWLEDNFLKMNINQVKNEVGYCFDERMLLHKDYLNCHVERPERAMAIYMQLEKKKLTEKMKRINVSEIEQEILLKIHPAEYIDKVAKLADEEFKNKSGTRLCYDTADNYYTYFSALLSAGGLINCCNELLKGSISSGFAIIRPPGHHAYGSECFGFCFFNNVAIAAKHLIGKTMSSGKVVSKVAIVDWDVHHGNGTQDLLYEDDQVLFISLHRFDKGQFYPFRKDANYKEVGKNKGEGFNINIPWNTLNRIQKSSENLTVNDEEYIAAFELIIKPILEEYNADIILVSSGFDAAENDQLGGLNLSPFAYYYMTKSLLSINKHVLVALEGGYNLDSLARCGEGIVLALLNETPRSLEILNKDYKYFIDHLKSLEDYKEHYLYPKVCYLEDLLTYRKHFSNYWKSLKDQLPEFIIKRLFPVSNKHNDSNQNSYIKLKFGKHIPNEKDLLSYIICRNEDQTLTKELNFRIIESKVNNFNIENENSSVGLTEKQTTLTLSRFLSDNKHSKQDLINIFKQISTELKENTSNEIMIYSIDDIEQSTNSNKQDEEMKNIKSRLRNQSKTTTKLCYKLLKTTEGYFVNEDFNKILSFLDSNLV